MDKVTLPHIHAGYILLVYLFMTVLLQKHRAFMVLEPRQSSKIQVRYTVMTARTL